MSEHFHGQWLRMAETSVKKSKTCRRIFSSVRNIWSWARQPYAETLDMVIIAIYDVIKIIIKV